MRSIERVISFGRKYYAWKICGVEKDYVDLFFILQHYPLHDLFALARKKYPGMDESLYLKAMVSYDDVDLSPIQYVEGYEAAPEVIFKSIQGHVDRYLKESVTGRVKS